MFNKKLEEKIKDLEKSLEKEIERNKIVSIKAVPVEELGDYTDWVFITQFNQDVMQKMSVKTSSSTSIMKDYQMSRAYALIGKTKDEYISAVRKEIEVGVENYPVFEKTKTELDEAKGQLVKYEEELVERSIQNKNQEDFINRIEQVLGKNYFIQIKNEFEIVQRNKLKNQG